VSRIVISFRREDSPAHAGLLYDWLCERYREEQVFMDVDTSQHGEHFIGAIGRAVQSADVMLVVIGRGWLDATDSSGRRRIDDGDDFVRAEIEAGLTANIRIIPILVGGAGLPREEDLPISLARLNRRQALHLDDRNWQSDLDQLGRILDVITGRNSGEEDETPGGSSTPSWLRVVAEKLRVGRLR
jgi:hypothetical protein